ncbi:hypothetical protein D3C71_865060 [compost metagenome]
MDNGVEFSGCDAERPVGPGDRHEFEFEPETIGHQLRDIRFATNRSLGVVAIDGKGQVAGNRGDRELARSHEFVVGADKLDRVIDLLSPYPFLLFR